MLAGLSRRTSRLRAQDRYTGTYHFDGATLSVIDLQDGRTRYDGRIVLAKLPAEACRLRTGGNLL